MLLAASTLVTTLIAATPVRLIVDTDAGFDVDDVGAIGVANALADNGECEIIAIGHTNGFVKGIGGVSTLMRFSGRDAPTTPLGSYKGPWAANPNAGKGTSDHYLSDLTDHYPCNVTSSAQTPTAVDVYRAALAASPYRSVRIASIGITTNMRDLLASPADAHSPLNGKDLVAEKVELVVWMDGMYNFGCAQAASADWLGPDTGCHGSAQAAVMNLPSSVKQIFSLVGGDVLHGGALQSCAAAGNPYRQAFEDWGVGGKGRWSWDPITVLIAVRGAEGVHCKETDAGGHMTVEVGGQETWHNHGDGGDETVYNQSRIAPGDGYGSAITAELDALLCKPPGQWSVTHWTAGLGENCYDGHGGTDLENPPSSSCGNFDTVAECEAKCLELNDCSAVTVQKTADGKQWQCFRKANIVYEECDRGSSFDTYVRHTYFLAGGFNCYGARGSSPAHGATDLETPVSSAAPGSPMTVRECSMLCDEMAACDSFSFQGTDHSGVGSCFRKSNVNLAKCDAGTGFDTYMSGV